MIQLAPQMRIRVAIEPADFRRGIDTLARLVREELNVTCRVTKRTADEMYWRKRLA